MDMTQQEETLLRIKQLGHNLAITITDRLAEANLPQKKGLVVLSVAVNEIIERTDDDSSYLRQMFKRSLDVCDET